MWCRFEGYQKWWITNVRIYSVDDFLSLFYVIQQSIRNTSWITFYGMSRQECVELLMRSRKQIFLSPRCDSLKWKQIISQPSLTDAIRKTEKFSLPAFTTSDVHYSHKNHENSKVNFQTTDKKCFWRRKREKSSLNHNVEIWVRWIRVAMPLCNHNSSQNFFHVLFFVPSAFSYLLVF